MKEWINLSRNLKSVYHQKQYNIIKIIIYLTDRMNLSVLLKIRPYRRKYTPNQDLTHLIRSKKLRVFSREMKFLNGVEILKRELRVRILGDHQKEIEINYIIKNLLFDE